MREQNIPAEIQQQIDYINLQKLILAEVPLDEVTDMPNYNQVLRVADCNMALSCGHLKMIPKRILIHKETGDELDLNLPIPNWEKSISDLAALVNPENGERFLVETNYYDDEENIIETTHEPVLVPILKYLKLMIQMKKFHEIFAMFTAQYVSDQKEIDIDYFKKIK